MAPRLRLAALASLILAWPIIAADRAETVARLRNDLSFLASAECEGRSPGSAGIDKAADYIADTFRKLGLKGAMPDGSYFQPFEIKGAARLAKDAELSVSGPDVGTMNLKLNSAFNPLAGTGSGKADAPIVFAGYGITSEALKYDDYADLDVAGKVVLVIRKTPRYGAENRVFTDEATRQQIDKLITPLAALDGKIANAHKHKAAALLLVNDASEKDDKLMTFNTATGGSETVPAFHIKRSVADLMLRTGMGKSLEEVERAIDADMKPISKPLEGWSAKANVLVERKVTPAKNVVAVLEGAGPLANETIVIGAHYDHLGRGGAGSLARGSKDIHFGADDNGSGTTAILELARRLSENPPANRRRLVFMTFSGEELGLLGSQHYASKPIFPIENTAAMLNLDMVGRLAEDPETKKGKLEVGGTGTAKGFDALLTKHNEKYDFQLKKTASGVGPSDHTSFYLKGVPVYFFFTGLHKEYHRPTDVVDLINFEGMKRITDMVEDISRELWVAESRPEYVKGQSTPTRAGSPGARGPSIRFMPGNYDDDVGGAPVGAVTKGGPADKAGIKDGDVIVEVAGVPVKNMTAYTAEMRKRKAGEPVEMVILRKGDKIKVKVTPE